MVEPKGQNCTEQRCTYRLYYCAKFFIPRLVGVSSSPPWSLSKGSAPFNAYCFVGSPGGIVVLPDSISGWFVG